MERTIVWNICEKRTLTSGTFVPSMLGTVDQIIISDEPELPVWIPVELSSDLGVGVMDKKRIHFNIRVWLKICSPKSNIENFHVSIMWREVLKNSYTLPLREGQSS